MSKGNKIGRLLVVLACGIALSALVLAGCSSGSSGGSSSADAKASKANAKYEVTIDDLTVGKDYKGNDAAIVTYTWKNNSDDAISAASALHMQAFQNGAELNMAVVSGGIDNDGYLKEMKPGAGNTFQLAYELDDTSDVTVEVEELINFSKEKLVTKTFSIG